MFCTSFDIHHFVHAFLSPGLWDMLVADANKKIKLVFFRDTLLQLIFVIINLYDILFFYRII